MKTLCQIKKHYFPSLLVPFSLSHIFTGDEEEIKDEDGLPIFFPVFLSCPDDVM